MDARIAALACAALFLLAAAPSASAITADAVSPASPYTSATGNATFACNATDETSVAGLSLYVWNAAEGLYYSNTTTLTGVFNQTNWTVADMPPGDYAWNCLAYDGDANGAWGANRTLHAGLFYLYEKSAENEETWAVAAADLDNDGDVDYISGNYNLQNRVYKNNGTGHFTLFESSSETDNTLAIAAADLDNDGDLDYIAGNYQEPNRIYLNDGTGHFTLLESSGGPDETYALAIADFDSDGDADYVAGKVTGAGKLEIFKNNGTGHFESAQNISAQSYHTVIAADFDGDGDTDIAAAGYPFQQATLYLNNGTGNMTAAQTLSTGNLYTSDLSAADLDNDGDMDIAQTSDRNFQAGEVDRNNGTGTFSAHSAFGNANQTYSLALGDIDNDGDVDAIAGNYEQNNHIILNNGTGHLFAFETTSGTERTVSVALADLDSDGDLDCIAGNADAENAVYLNRQNDNNYVSVLFRCGTANATRDCLGARVNVTNSGAVAGYSEVTAPGQTREGTLRLHFGLDAGTTYTVNATLQNGHVISCSVQPPAAFTAYDNGSATGGAACFVTGLPPAVTLLSPPDDGMRRISTVNYSCTATDDTGLANITLYVWEADEGLYYQGTSAASGFYGLSYWNVPMDVGGTYHWNCLACDTSKCSQSAGNRTLKVIDSAGLTLRLFLNGTETVHVPGGGDYNSSLLNTTETSPGHFYVASYGSGAFSALVFSGYSPWSIAAENVSGGHYIQLSQELSGSRAFLAFSRGGWESVEWRVYSIESGEFMQEILPSFSYGLGNRNELTLALYYPTLDLSGRLRLGRGTHRIGVENNGTSSGRPAIALGIR